VDIYIAHIKAADLVPMCRIDLFDEGGVQRRYNDKHVIRIAEAMADPTTLWLDPLLGSLEGNWSFEKGMIIGDDKAMISLDDGQHRWLALQSGLLNDAEVARLEFEIKVVKGLTRAQRMRVFRSQAQRRRIDRRLDLAQRHELCEWPNSTHAHAYAVVLALNTEVQSPLRGRVQLIDDSTRPYEGGGGRPMIASSGLHTSLVTVFGRKSPLHAMNETEQKRVIMDMIRIASRVWSGAWNSDRHILTTSRGINALLRLCISGAAFRSVVGMSFTSEDIERAFRYSHRFKWASSVWKNRATKDISDSLNQSIELGMARELRRQHAASASK